MSSDFLSVEAVRASAVKATGLDDFGVDDDNYQEALNVLLESLSGRKGVLRKEGQTLRKVFQDGDLIAKIEGALDKAGYKTELTTDEEHGLWEIETTTNTGVNLVIDWNFASFVELGWMPSQVQRSSSLPLASTEGS